MLYVEGAPMSVSLNMSVSYLSNANADVSHHFLHIELYVCVCIRYLTLDTSPQVLALDSYFQPCGCSVTVSLVMMKQW